MLPSSVLAQVHRFFMGTLLAGDNLCLFVPHRGKHRLGGRCCSPAPEESVVWYPPM